MAVCAAFDPLGPYVVNMVDFVDCHARVLGEQGYRALASGTTIGAAVTGLVTIYIAMVGYRMLFGEIPAAREAVLAAVKIGFVLALATQWPAYQALVYDVVIDEPASLASRILAPSGFIDGDQSDLIARAQSIYDAIDQLAHPPTSVPGTAADARQPAAAAQPLPTAAIPVISLPQTQTEGLARAESIFVTGALGGLLSTRVVAGVLLALGPLFVGFLLFDATFGLFVGWLRALAATIIGGFGVLAVLAIENEILAPQVGSLGRALASGLSVPTLSLELGLTATLFAALVVAVLVGAAIVAVGLRAPMAARIAVRQIAQGIVSPSRQTSPGRVSDRADDPLRSRAQTLVDAVRTSDRRETRVNASGAAAGRLPFTERLLERAPKASFEPLGQSGKRTATRNSASARQRDGRQ